LERYVAKHKPETVPEDQQEERRSAL
jgi:hypothetical protein